MATTAAPSRAAAHLSLSCAPAASATSSSRAASVVPFRQAAVAGRTQHLVACGAGVGSRRRQQRQSGRGLLLQVYADAGAASPPLAVAPAITLSDNALAHLLKLRAGQNTDLLLRVGVRQGGCSGMSYVMDFEERAKVRSDDTIIDYEGFSMVTDPKSLLYLFGMRLDYSDALIGGGFSFSNPNATSTCGCGKSFAA